MVVLVVGLDSRLLAHAPRMSALAGRGAVAELEPVWPAVTCSVQASMLTGRTPAAHGIVGNGWYDRTLAEVQFWKQSNALVAGDKVWEAARAAEPGLRTAQLFWWFNMYAGVDYAVTPRPVYKADGRKLPDVHSHPAELRDELQARFGTFPLFHFWGPTASIVSSRWIADAALDVERRHRPDLSLVYLPHLDYPLQRLGPDHPDVPREVAAVDALVGELIDAAGARGVRVVVVSEYAIESARDPVAPNRALRASGHLRVRLEDGRELLDAGASRAFAVADHQTAHVYVRDPDDIRAVAERLAALDGVERVLDREAMAGLGLDHARAGDLFVVAEAGRWLSYYYWQDDARAPDFARTVDIHRKPGYDPAELFFDPAIRFPKLRAASLLARKKLGFRTLFEMVPPHGDQVRGSHGRVDPTSPRQPLCIVAEPDPGFPEKLPATGVRDVILRSLGVG